MVALHGSPLLNLQSQLLVICLLIGCHLAGTTSFGSNCGNHRRLYDSEYGQIDNHQNGTFNCEWLVSARVGQFINLQIISNGANCSTDTVYIFDGASYEDTLISAVKLDGQLTHFAPLIASSGRMLLLQYWTESSTPSDFVATFSITQCPLNCSNHGTCTDHQCLCDEFWTGNACQFPSCPAKCFPSGKCTSTSSSDHCLPKSPHRCECMPDYIGQSCTVVKSQFASPMHRQPKWELLFANEKLFRGRASHSSTYDPVTDTIFTFGGRGAYESTLGDLLAYSISSNQWHNLSSCQKEAEGQPDPRWGHSLITFNSSLLLFGGILTNGTLSNQLWSYAIPTRKWTLKRVAPSKILPLAFHSATLVDSEWLYIYGGRQEDASHSSNVYRINLAKESPSWQLVQVLNDRPFGRQLIGHSAVFYKHLRSIVIFGGASWRGRQRAQLSNDLHLFNVDNRVWSRLKFSTSQDSHIPSPRAFHSMLLLEHYLLIFGGHTENCSKTRLFVYSLICHKWWSHLDHFMSSLSWTFPTAGLTSHSSVLRENLVFVLGGFSSHVRHEVYVFDLHKVLFNASQYELCSHSKSKSMCSLAANCSWCPIGNGTGQNRSGYCVHDNFQCSSQSVGQLNYCPGLCPRLGTCYSCLANTIENIEIYKADNFGGFPLLHQSNTCQWNSLDLQCFRANFSQSAHSSHFLVSFNDCIMHNIESGITFLKYFYPQNVSRPDQSLVLPRIDVKTSFNSAFSKNLFRNQLETFKQPSNESLLNIGRLLGHIHPFGLKPFQENRLRLYLASTSPFSTFFFDGHPINSSNISVNSSNTLYRSYFDFPINFSSDTLLEDNFLIDLIVQFPIRTTFEKLEYESIEVNFADSANSVLSNSNLTPFRDPHQCQQLSGCTACLSNRACAWCSTSSQCTTRSNPNQCRTLSENVVVDSEECVTCSDFLECQACLSSPSDWCEWLPEESQCLRRGRSPRSIQQLSSCPPLCTSRLSCSLCFDHSHTGQCVWCQSRQQCISAAAYHSSPAYFDYCHSFESLQLFTHRKHFFAELGLNDSQILCDKCLRHSNCLLCENVPTCGWCSLQSDSSQAFCTTKNHLNENECNLGATLTHSSIVIVDGPRGKFIPAYNGSCPLVNECQHEHLHNCHPEADCIDTDQSFWCTCRPGFSGDGQNCVRTCTKNCVHGFCSEFPDYRCICDLGWTGPDCSTDCGCNNHSTCHSGLGKCDQCKDGTTGEHCHLCAVGSFGSATNSTVGCTPCDCNLHEDTSRGSCDTETGHCYCLHSTEGPKCERCQTGFYGDARHGGNCFLECQDRAVIAQVDQGYFGSYIRNIHFKRQNSPNDLPAAHISCLWIFTTHKSPAKSDTFANYYAALNHSVSFPIKITIFNGAQLNCSSSKVSVYDGIPQFISASAKIKFLTLSNLCGRNVLAEDVTVVSMSGFVTVYYTSESLLQGFNASFARLSKTKVEDRIILPTKNLSTISLLHQKTLFENLIDDNNWPTGKHLLYKWENFFIFLGGREDSVHLHITAFDKVSKSWLSNESMNVGIRPENRYLYASVHFKNILFVSGGLSSQNNTNVLQDFWSCVAIKHPSNSRIHFEWSKIEAHNHEIIPPLLGHTLTPVVIDSNQNEAILLVGGYSPTEGFVRHQFIYLPTLKQWKIFHTKGALPVGIFGHSAVYWKNQSAVYLFGGVGHDETQKSIISDTLYVLNMTTQVWHRVRPNDPARGGPWPSRQYLSLATVTHNYMIISGGQDQDGELAENLIWVYQFYCGNWIPLNMSLFDTDQIDRFLINQPRIQSMFYDTFDNLLYLYETATFSNSTEIMRKISTIQMPNDFCVLFSSNQSNCLSRSNIFVKEPKCSIPKQSLDCSMYDNCIDCTTRNYAVSVSTEESCQWCTNCRDKQGHCIALNDTCDWLQQANTSRIDVCHYTSIETTSQCPLQRCLATDCEKCLQISQPASGDKSACIWTRQIYKFVKFGHNPEMSPIEDWTCIDSAVIEEALLTNVETVPPLSCPGRCHQHSTCSLCLEAAIGDESGSHECLYDAQSRECISPTYALLRCSGGRCGSLIRRQLCPVDCESHSKASDCLSAAHCGWCAIYGFQVDGVGVCLRGGLFDSFTEPCSGENANLITYLVNKPFYKPITSFTVQWHYLYLPKENECANGHHTCDSISQECVDLEDGFMCRCKPEYILVESNVCRPICIQGCIHGVCVKPNLCECNFGYIGSDCSLKCKCNGHANCLSAENLDHCLECKHNTLGPQCSKCQPFFVGDPKNGGACTHCGEYCHNHSNKCFSEDLLKESLANRTTDPDFWDDLSSKVIEGITESRAVCVDCQNNTEGERCDRCRLGFFKISDDIRDGCRQCVCGQHGWLCNPFNGENCNCQNNTENDRQCNYLNTKEYSSYINKTYFIKSAQVMTTYSLPCWMLQCSKCKEFYYGLPTNGHQCYRHMNYDKEYCLDSEQDTDCMRNPKPILLGRLIFFAIQPRFMNVDIKIILAVTKGEVDMYLASKDDLFVVKTNQSNGFHHTYIDKNYLQSQFDQVLTPDQKEEFSWSIDDSDELSNYKHTIKEPFHLREEHVGSATPKYFTVTNLNEIAVFRKVRYRLEVTIPYKTQDLRVTRYFLAIRGKHHPFLGKNGDRNLGYILFRQDQCRIDLFVFFSVFFSAFFFFITFFFSFFKMKQIYLSRRAQQLHQIELQHMASRPFACIFLLPDIYTDPAVGFRKCSTCGKNTTALATPSKRMSLFRHLTQGFRESPKIYPEGGPVQVGRPNDKSVATSGGSVRPVAIEPTSDGLAAVLTTLVQLPGGIFVPNSRVAAASTLVSLQHSPHIGQQFS